MELNEILEWFENHKSEYNRNGMARFGINVEKAYGVSIKELEPLHKNIKTDHQLALQLWNTGMHEARLLAFFIADANELTDELLDEWVAEFNSWDTVDQACNKLFRRSNVAISKISDWIEDEREFVRRTGFSMLATLAVHKRGDAADEFFIEFFPQMKKYATDERNFVKKCVNWAIRQSGKRNERMRELAIELCEDILKEYPNSKSARWIAKDALNELQHYQFRHSRSKS
jgi:3-methyladenine DNA glycosylase AlkD